MHYFQHFVEGRHFHIATDHKPLIPLPSPTAPDPPTDAAPGFIAPFTSDIWYIKGAANTAADTLSRLELDHLREPAVLKVDFQALAEAQRKDTLHPDSATTSLHLQEIHFSHNHHSPLQCLYWDPQAICTPQFLVAGF